MIYTVHAKTADDAAGDQAAKTHEIRTENMRKRGIKAMNRYYVYVVNAVDITCDAICCDYNNALVWLNEFIDKELESRFPVKACILNDKMDVVYKTEVKGKNDSKGRSNTADKE